MIKDQLFHYIISPTLEVRKEPNGKSEVVSEGLFSENIRVLDKHEDWLKIQTTLDGYMGWVKSEGVCSRATPFHLEESSRYVKTGRLITHLYEIPDTVYGPILTVPFESSLYAPNFQDDGSRWLKVTLPNESQVYVQRGDLVVSSLNMKVDEVCEFSRFFLGLPYTWGGRSSFGYDCSGFVQMLYRQMGIFLPRDSKDQFACSEFFDSPVNTLEPGDLIFFGFSKESIKHVGLSLGQGAFIHTCAVTENMPYVRISHIKDDAWNGSGYYPFLAGRKRVSIIR